MESSVFNLRLVVFGSPDIHYGCTRSYNIVFTELR